MKADTKAAAVRWGVEIETIIPVASPVIVGDYHRGCPVLGGPHFGAATWRADSDSSIKDWNGYKACEFVSPILDGPQGVLHLVEFVKWAKSIGARVKKSTGCHITIGIESVTGPLNITDLGLFCYKVTRLANRHAWAVYSQSGVGRHLNGYCAPNNMEAVKKLKEVFSLTQGQSISFDAERGLVNLMKAFKADDTQRVIEFRAFIGTLDATKILHHLATCIGLMRMAARLTVAEVETLCDTTENALTAPEALGNLHRLLGWTDESLIALGMFGAIVNRARRVIGKGLTYAAKFERNYPKAYATS